MSYMEKSNKNKINDVAGKLGLHFLNKTTLFEKLLETLNFCCVSMSGVEQGWLIGSNTNGIGDCIHSPINAYIFIL